MGATARDSVVDDVDAGLDPVAGPGGGDHRPDGLSHPAPATDDTAHVLRGDVNAEPHRGPPLLGVDHHCLGVRGDRRDQIGHHGQRRPTRDPIAGIVVVILNTTLVFTPIPLSNVVPALVIALIALAYLEEDGLLLSIALLAAVLVVAIELVAVWETVLGAKWVSGLW